MTPARRRRLFRVALVLCAVMAAGVAGRLFFLGQSVPSLLLGRKPGSARPGTLLVHEMPATNSAARAKAPAALPSPVKVKFNLLGGWKYVEGKTAVPDKVRALDGKRVEIVGFMMPINEPTRLTRFIVVQSLWGCCFGQTPAVNHVVVVAMEPGKYVDFYPDPVRVTGVFSVGETREEGYLVSVYRLAGDRVVVR
jgi:hypothetical protein